VVAGPVALRRLPRPVLVWLVYRCPADHLWAVLTSPGSRSSCPRCLALGDCRAYARIDEALEHQADEELEHQVDEELEHQVDEELEHQVDEELEHQVDEELEDPADPILEALVAVVDEALKRQVNEDLKRQVDEDLGHQVDEADGSPKAALCRLAAARSLGWLPADALVDFLPDYGWVTGASRSSRPAIVRAALRDLVADGEWQEDSRERRKLYRPGRWKRAR
jgi:hypothetical protein